MGLVPLIPGRAAAGADLRRRLRAPRGLALIACAATLAGATAGCPSRWAEFRILELRSGRVTAVDGAGFKVLLRCKVENPNPIGAEVHDLRFRATADDFLLGEGRVRGFVKRVEARSRFILEVPVQVAYARLPPDFPRRTAGGKLRMRTEAWFTARTRFGSYDMQLVSVDRAVIDDALKVGIMGAFKGEALRIERIAVRSIGLRGMQIDFAAQARNMFPFPLTIRGARYELSINGIHFGRGKLERELRLAARGRASLELTVSATHGAVARALGELATTDPRFRVRGTISVAPVAGIAELPIDITADSSVFAR